MQQLDLEAQRSGLALLHGCWRASIYFLSIPARLSEDNTAYKTKCVDAIIPVQRWLALGNSCFIYIYIKQECTVTQR